MPPRITLALLAYNQERYIELAMRSALAQECEPIEIIASDDCSTDGTYRLMQAIGRAYSGPHRIVVRRNRANGGIGRHFNELMTLAQGRLVVLMAGDDVSLPNRVAQTARAWDESGERLDLIAAHVFDMSEGGTDLGVTKVGELQRWRSVDHWAAGRPYIIGAAHATTRRLFDRFGPLADDVWHEDQVNVLRAVCAGGAVTVDQPLVRYRRGGLSTWRFSPHVYRNFEHNRNERHLAVFQQWLRDAEKVGQRSTVEAGIDWEMQRALFIRRLLAGRTIGEQLKAVLAPSETQASWRWKRLVTLRLPHAYLMMKHVRSRRAAQSGAAARFGERTDRIPPDV